MSVKIYHNPRCSKSRQTLALIEEKGITPEIVEYLKNEPSVSDIKNLLAGLGMEPRDLMRKGEAVYKELNLKNQDLSQDELINAMAENPILIERPIVITDKGMRIGRPPELVNEIL